MVISTAHKAKGREWESVRLAPDFASTGGRNGIPTAEVRLFYVAMTRAKKLLVVAPEMLTLFGTDAWKEKRAVEREARNARNEAAAGSASRTSTANRAHRTPPSAPAQRQATPKYTGPIERISPHVARQHPASSSRLPPTTSPSQPGLLQKIARFFGG